MKKWKYENEIKNATTTLLNAYKALSHSKTITVIFTVGESLFYHDLTDEELSEITRLNGKDKLSTQTATKKRTLEYLANSVKFADVNYLNELKTYFPQYNNGYISEFAYRIKVTHETIDNIKNSDNSKPFDKASDTKDGKQIKNIDNGATFTKIEYLLKVAKEKNLETLSEIENAVETLNKIYE